MERGHVLHEKPHLQPLIPQDQNLPQQYNEIVFHLQTLNTNMKPSYTDSRYKHSERILIIIILNIYVLFCIIDDIILTSLCLRLCSLGNDPVVGSLVMWVVWKREVGVPIPDWNGMHSPHESV